MTNPDASSLPPPPAGAENLSIIEDGRSQPMAPPVLVTDPHEPDAPQAEQHAAQISQAFGVRPFFWKDIQLAPFAIDREGDWMRHRELLGEPQLQEVIRIPHAVVPDALRVLWFCAHHPDTWLLEPSMLKDDKGEWRRVTGLERALNIEKKIRAWAAENVTRNEALLAVDVFYEIFNSAQSTRTAVKPSEHQREESAKN